MESDKKIIILTAPSGGGKTSIMRFLLNRFPILAFSVSATTRERRGDEQDGTDYYFISPAQFQEKIQQEAFVEWEMVYQGKYYGTLKSDLERIWKQGKIPVLDIDVKGAIHVQQQYPKQTLSVFIDPPSLEELKKRLLARGTESADSLEARINKASYEISFKSHFNKVIINDHFDQACREAEKIVLDFTGTA